MNLSRRKLILGTAPAAIAVSILPSIIFENIAKASVAATSVVQASDENFATEIDRLFPGLSGVPAAQSLLRHSFLITNATSSPVFAYSVKWTARASSASIRRVFVLRPSALLGKRQYTAQDPLLACSETALVTPVALIHSLGFSTRYTSSNAIAEHLNALVQKRPKAAAFASVNSSSTPVVGATAYESSVVGSGNVRYRLASSLRNQRNGERDEAWTLLQNSLAPDGSVDIALLTQNANYSMITHGQQALARSFKDYSLSRVRFAETIGHLAATKGKTRVKSVLDLVAGLPPSTLG